MHFFLYAGTLVLFILYNRFVSFANVLVASDISYDGCTFCFVFFFFLVCFLLPLLARLVIVVFFTI
jgi:hypothetical protein